MNRLVWQHEISVISIIFKRFSMSFWRKDFPIKSLKPKLLDTDLSLILIFKHARCTWSHTGYADHVWNASLAGCTKLVRAVYWGILMHGCLKKSIECQRKFDSPHFTPYSLSLTDIHPQAPFEKWFNKLYDPNSNLLYVILSQYQMFLIILSVFAFMKNKLFSNLCNKPYLV